MFEILVRASPFNHVTTIVLKSMHLLSVLLILQTILESSSRTERIPSHNAHTMDSVTVSCTIFCNYEHCMFAVILQKQDKCLNLVATINTNMDFSLITIMTRRYIGYFICIRILLIMITIWVASIAICVIISWLCSATDISIVCGCS